MRNTYNLIVDEKKLFSVESDADSVQLLATVAFYFGAKAKIKWKMHIDAPIIMRHYKVKKSKNDKIVDFFPPFFNVVKNTNYVLTSNSKKQFFLFAIADGKIKVLKSPWNCTTTRAMCMLIPQFRKFTFKQKLNEAEKLYLEQKIKSGDYIDFLSVVKQEREKIVGALINQYEKSNKETQND